MVRIGNIDGKGKIYDDRGELILNSGEQILYKSYEKRCIAVYKNWRKRVRKVIFESTAEFGTTYVTNQRIVHIRTPDPYKKAKDELTPLGIPGAIPKMMGAKEIVKKGGKEYCEIYFNEIKWYEPTKKNKVILFYTIVPPDHDVMWVIFRDKKDDNKIEIIRKLVPKDCIPVKSYKEIQARVG